MPRYQPRAAGSRRPRRLTPEERAAVGSMRRVTDPQGRRWIVRHETTDAVLSSWALLVPALLAPLELWRFMRRHGVTAIYADCADGSSHRIALGTHACVHEAMDRVVAAVEAGDALPTSVDG